MAKIKIIYSCQSCGYQSPKWLGRCPDCNQWNSLVEEKQERASHPRGELSLGSKEDPSPIHAIATDEDGRVLSGIGEFDRVLGGGLVAGSVILIGGDPGIGKSTLLLQAFAAISQTGLTCLYVSGEESQRQIKMRAERLGIAAPNLLVLSETSLERIIEQVKKLKPGVLVIDSIQTIFTSTLPSAPGSIAQVRESSGSIIVLAKKTGLTTFLIGHVTKDGAIAGPRVLEHMVDTVLYFEGERGHSFRILRAVKNRFGSTNEIGVFEMKEAGLKEVTNPSEIFLMERPLEVPGSAVVCSPGGAATHDHRRGSQPRGITRRGFGEKNGRQALRPRYFRQRRRWSARRRTRGGPRRYRGSRFQSQGKEHRSKDSVFRRGGPRRRNSGNLPG